MFKQKEWPFRTMNILTKLKTAIVSKNVMKIPRKCCRKKSWGTNKDRTNATYETTDAESKEDCKLLTDLGWETLQNRRKKQRLVILFKILHGLTPVYLNDLLPPLVQDTTSYNLRNSNHFQNYRANINLFLNSFFSRQRSVHGTISRRGQGCAISGCIQITFKQGSKKTSFVL